MPYKGAFFQVLNELLPMKIYFGQEWFEEIHNSEPTKEVLLVCSSCHKVIDEKAALAQLEACARKYMGVYFSHGLCQECFEKEMAKIKRFKSEQSTDHQVPGTVG